MVQFEKTRIHPVSAVLFFLGLYAIAGFAYAVYLRSDESLVIWAVVAALSLIASAGYQRFVTKKRGRTQ